MILYVGVTGVLVGGQHPHREGEGTILTKMRILTYLGVKTLTDSSGTIFSK